MWVTSQAFVGSLACQCYFKPGIVDVLVEKVFARQMAVHCQSLTMVDCFWQISEDVVLPDLYPVHDGTTAVGGLRGKKVLVVFRICLWEDDRETMNGFIGEV